MLYVQLLQVSSVSKTPSTLHRFQTKTILFCSGYGYRPHYIAENDHRKRINSKTLSRVERFENGTVENAVFLVWTAKMMLSENEPTTLGCRPFNREYPTWGTESLLIAVIISLLTHLEAHLTLLRLLFDFSRKEQDIVRLLTSKPTKT